MKLFFLLTLSIFLASFLSAQDETPPVALCKDITVYINDEGLAELTPEDIDDGSYDEESGIDFMELSEYELWCDATWEEFVIVVLSVYDLEGNSAECEAQVTVLDDLAPNDLYCMDLEVELNDQGFAEIEPWDLDGGSNDNCGIADIELSQNIFTCEHIGENIVEVIFYDDAGNSASCESIVTVIDLTDPVAVCLYGGIVVYLDNGYASITLEDINDGYSACRISSAELSQSEFTCEDIGSFIVTLTVTDWDNNVTSCDTEVTVDEDDPILEAVCQDVTVTLSDGEAEITFEDIDGGSSASCGFTYDISQTTFDESHIGDNYVTLTLTGASNNTSDCEAVVTVEAGEEEEDTTPPVALCRDITLYLHEEDGFVEIFPEDIDNGSYDDASGIATLELSEVEYWCDNIWEENIITLTVMDNAGNVSECEAVVTILDVTAPTDVECFDITVELEDGYAFIEGWDVIASVNDNCGIEEVVASQSEFFCEDLGDVLITVTLYDASGNFSECEATVTVVDNAPGVAVCLFGGITVYLEDGFASIDLFDINEGYDNCNIVSSELSQTEFTCEDLGDVEVVLTVTDNEGNVSTCTTEVTVDVEGAVSLPVAICQDITIQLEDGVASISAEDIDGGSYSDFCSFTLSASQSEFTADHVGENVVILTVTTSAGKTGCEAIVTVEDDEVLPPVAVCNDITIYLDGSGSAHISAGDVDGGSYDATGIFTLELSQADFDCDHVGENTVTLTIINGAELSDACEATVTVVDDTAPTLICADFSVELIGGEAYILPEDVGGSFDNCGIASMELSVEVFLCEDIGENVVELTVTDIHGNSSSCEAVVNVLGTFPTVEIVKNNLPEFCQGAVVELEAVSNDATIYFWSSEDDERNIISNGDLPRVLVAASGLYTVRVANAYGCAAEADYELELDVTALTSSYVILANNVAMKRSTVNSGGIGIMDSKGTAKFESNTQVTAEGTFVKTPKFDIKSGSVVSNQIGGIVSVDLPEILSNPHKTGGKDDLKIPNNAVVTVDGSIFNKIDIGKNARVTFTSPVIYAKEYLAKDGSEVSFAGCTQLILSNKMYLEKNTVTNPENNKLVIFNDNKKKGTYFEVGGDNVVFNGSLNMPTTELKTAKGKADKPIVLTGQFIVDKVSGDDHVIWAAGTACECEVDPGILARVANTAAPVNTFDREETIFSETVDLTAFPNPFYGRTNLRFVSPQEERVVVSIYSFTGQEVSRLFDGLAEAGREYSLPFDAGTLAPGMYLYKVETASGLVKVQKLVLSK